MPLRLILFAVYLVFYAGFVVVAALSPAAMDASIAGVNASVWLGFGLIIAAIVLSFLYGALAQGDDADATHAGAAG